MQVLRLGTFSPSVVLGAAAGPLRAAGLSVVDVPAASSSEQFTALLSGALDAVLTSPDNVLAHRGTGADVRVLAAIDRGLGLSLFAAPGLDPRAPGSAAVDPGRPGAPGVLAVDSPTSGFAFVAYELLARAGIDGYEARPFGSTPRRASALIAGECAMTVLGAGSDLRAEAAGCTRINRASSLGPYVGTVLAAASPVPDGVAALATALVRTARALVAGQLTADPTPLGLDAASARRYLATLVDPREGLVPDGRLDDASLATLVRLRERYAPGTGHATTGLVDDRFAGT